MARGKFTVRDGVVAPVVERVLVQMKAANVLGVSRAMASRPGEVGERSRQSMESLRAYASLLGEEKADEELRVMEENLNYLSASPMAAKAAVANAFTAQRRNKTFNKKP